MTNLLFGLNCPECGKKIHEDDRVCPHCGVDLDAPLPPDQARALFQTYFDQAQQALDQNHNLPGALRDCQQALQLLPESAEAHNLHGLILDALGRSDEALRAYREAVRLNPAFAEAKENLQSAEAEFQGGLPVEGAALLEPDTPQRGRAGQIVLIVLAALLLVVLGAAGAFFAIRTLTQTTIVYEPDLTKIASVSRADLDTAVQVLKQRWNSLGYPEMEVSVSGNNQIVARTPRQVDALDILSSKAIGLVEFVDLGKNSMAPGTRVRTDLEVSYLPQVEGKAWHTLMTNREVSSATLQTDSTGGIQIAFTLNPEGTKLLADFSSRNIGSVLGIVVDKSVVSAPSINSAITNGKGLIAGKYTRDEALKIAEYLRMPPLPILFK